MLIDWFTVGAQILNFAILVWLMKRFLYQPILNAIDAREKSIADERAAADAMSREANAEKADFEQKNHQFDQQREALLATATAAAETERQRLLQDARTAASALDKKHQQVLENQQQALNQTLSNLVQHEVFAMTEKVLQDLASAELETQIVTIFIARLQALDSDATQPLQQAVASEPATGNSSNLMVPPMIIQSGFALSSTSQQLISTALTAVLGDKVTLLFSTCEALICGIELDVPGFKLGWSIADYLATMQNALSNHLAQLKIDSSQQPDTSQTTGTALSVIVNDADSQPVVPAAEPT